MENDQLIMDPPILLRKPDQSDVIAQFLMTSLEYLELNNIHYKAETHKMINEANMVDEFLNFRGA